MALVTMALYMMYDTLDGRLDRVEKRQWKGVFRLYFARIEGLLSIPRYLLPGIVGGLKESWVTAPENCVFYNRIGK
jgi:hypothetical protein